MRFLLFLAVFSFSTIIKAQSELHIANYYGYRDGLNNFLVYCMHQDSKGFLWLGTKEGLNRFDGYQFKKYFTERNNLNSLSHNKVFDILEYQPGHLLIATSNGLSVFNSNTGGFENEMIQFAPLAARSGAIVSSMFQDEKLRIWINHSGEIDVFDKNLKYLYRFTDLPWAQSMKGVICWYDSWYMDQKGRLWLPTDDAGMHIIDVPNQKIYNKHYNPEHLPYLEYNSIRSFLLDEKNQTLWLGPWGDGLIRYDLVSGNISQEFFHTSERGEARTINALLQTNHQTLLFTLNGNCYEMNPVTMAYKEVPESDGKLQARVNGEPFVSSLCMMRSDDLNYWIGGTGLYLLKTHKTQTDLMVIPQANSDDCADLIISDSGTIYSLHDYRLLIAVDQSRRNVMHYQVPGHTKVTLTEVCEDQSGRIWIGTTRGIQLFDPQSETFHAASFLHPDLKNANINVLFRDSQGNIWIATRESFHLYRHDVKSGQTLQIDQETVQQFDKAGATGRISSITEDAKGRLWMTSILSGGILCYELTTDQWKSYPSGTRNHNLLVNKGIVSSLPDHDDDILWLSTFFGDGLVAYHYIQDSIVYYTREQGLLSDYIQTISAGDGNQLWLTSEFGVTQFSTSTGEAESNILFESERFAFESFQVALDEQNDQLVLGIHDRYTFISTQNNSSQISVAKPLLDRIYFNNKEQFTDLANPVFHLQHGQNNIAIDFTAVHYTNADKLEFAYRLEGADDDWKYTTLNRSAQYASLSPGNYAFHLKVGDESRNWGPEYSMMSFTIAPPFWQAPWFIFCVTAFVACIASWLVRKRIRTIRYEAGLKQKIAETEMMALRAQMNPHFIFNCINSIDSLIQDNDKYHATVYLNKFAKLIRCILDSSKQNTVTLANDMETLQLYIEMEQFRNDHRFTAEIKADPALLQDDFKVPPLIIQPYVENAILHGLQNRKGTDGRLSISLNRLSGQIQYIIEDNGVGRPHTQNGHSTSKVSYGMQMSSERIKLFNQEENASVEITDLVNNGISSGTRVEVLLNMV